MLRRSMTAGSLLVCVGCAPEPADDTDPTATTSMPMPGTTSGDPGSTDAESTGEPPPDDTGVVDTGEVDGSSDGGSSTGEAPPVCGNGVAERDEQCDGTDFGDWTCIAQGFEGGELACDSDCDLVTDACFFFICGNGTVQGDEVCDSEEVGGLTCLDQGFDSGTLVCNEFCTDYDTSGCGTCGNGVVDGDEICEVGDIPAAETCMSYGFDSGDVGCAGCAIDTASCGTCGNGIKDGAEACDGVDLGGDSCMSLFASTGTLGCEADCSYDVTGCDLAPVVYDISAPNTSSTQTNYFRGHGYAADGDGQLLDFEVYLGLAGACDLDFYVYEAAGFGGPYTQVTRTTVNAGPGMAYYAAGIPTVPITNGMYYILGVGWNCSATYYWDGSGAYAGIDAGVGIFNVSHWDNSYPGASDMYVPPNTGGGSTVYVHKVVFAE